MNRKTPCFIVSRNEYVIKACLRELPEESYSEALHVEDKGKKYTLKGWETDIGFARDIAETGKEQGKPISMEIVVKRKDGTLRYALQTEWMSSLKKRASLKGTIKTQLSENHSKANKGKPRGRIGRVF